jgi:hypothetical protein
MSMVNAPYGLKPVKRADGLPYAGATSQDLINPAGTATNIFNGSVVNLDSNGYIVLSTATGADATTNALPAGTTLTGSLGVFVGCEYVNAQGQLIFSQYYPASYAAPTGTSIKAYVVDDPNVMFQAQLTSTGAQTIVGTNTFFSAVQSTSTGNTATGNSTSALTASVVTTTAAFRIMAIVSPAGDSFAEVLVKFNPGYHSLTNAVGL